MTNCSDVLEVCLQELCSDFIQENLSNEESNSNTYEISKIGFIFIIISAAIVGGVLTGIISNRHYAKKQVQASTSFFRNVTIKSQHKTPAFTIDEIGRPMSGTRYEGSEIPVNLTLDESIGEPGRLQKLVGNFESTGTDYRINNEEELSSNGSETHSKSNFLQSFKKRFRSNKSFNNRRKSTFKQRRRGSSKLSAVAINPTIVRKPRSKRQRQSEEDKDLESNL